MNKDTMKALHMLAFILVVIGGLNWGLVGLFQVNVVYMILGSVPLLERLVYVIVGVSTVYIMLTHMSDCRVCSGKK